MENRPNPETLLHKVQQEEIDEKQGKLKIYLGASPGVGKTYSMLQDAIIKRNQGLDVVIGIIETHGRVEIEALLKNFEILPRQTVDYREKKLTEFDLDSAIKRNPALILVDEMAHNNVPGLRHAKRWQDIKELLDCGIDVYTTLNVQHIESLNDVVELILHTKIKETVPDTILNIASTIELVDLPPEDLLKRLQEGKVYFPEQAELAKDNFFRKGNLIALRELALRFTAERVGTQVLLYRQDLGIKHIWPTREKILVLVGSSPDTPKIIRSACRLATNLQTDWVAVHVDTPRHGLSEEQRNNAIQNLRAAEQLGAETRILSGFDIVKEVINFAHEQNVTQIMVGKRIRQPWREYLFRSLADEIISHSGEIDVYIITESNKLEKYTAPKIKGLIPWSSYIISVAIIAIATILNFTIFSFVNSNVLILIYLLAVTLVTLLGVIGPSVLASILSVLTYAFFFIKPYYSFAVGDPQDFMSLGVMLIVSQSISYFSILTKQQAKASRFIEQHTAALHSLSRQLASSRGVDKLLTIGCQYIGESLKAEVLALLPEASHLVIRTKYKSEQSLDIKELGVAQWVYDMGQVAGLGTDTLPFSEAVYVPLLASQGIIGVLRVKPLRKGSLFNTEQMHLLESSANQIALAIEIDRIQEISKKIDAQSESEAFRSTLLKTVSHDLKTPLVAVMGAATTIVEMSKQLERNQIKKLGQEIFNEAEQLNRLLNNLLQITYLEAKSIKLEKTPTNIKEILNTVITNFDKKSLDRSINIHIQNHFPLVPVDKILIQDTLINLIDNAIKFTPPGSKIDITANYDNKQATISIEDRGPGIVTDEIDKLFEKYYRGRLITTKHGLGLGLAICRSIVEAHGGKIWAENRKDGGAAFKFTLPVA